MAQTIKLKRSAVAGRIPDVPDLALGEIAINTYDGKMYIKKNVDGTETVIEVGSSGAQLPTEGIWKQYSYTASAGQTVFSGDDNNSQSLTYSAGYIEVYLNGILLDPAVDYTATTGNSITLSAATELDDLVQIDSFSALIGPGDIVVNTFTGDGTTTSFALGTSAGTEQNVSVFIDGVYQEKDTFSLSGDNLVFTEAPYTDASIEAVIGSRNITVNDIEDLTITGNFSTEGTISAGSASLTGALDSGSVTTGNVVSSGSVSADSDITSAGDVEGTSLSLTGSAGAMTWNSDEETLNIPLNSNVTLQAGQENVFRIKATEAISNGEVVMFAGAQGDHILGAKADQQAVGFSPEYVIGVATQDFSTNEFGFVTTFGKVRGLDTSGYSEGDILYLNPTVAGELTTTKPTPPDHVYQIAAVLSSNPAEGTILVRPTHFSDTDEVPEGLTNLYYTDTRANSAIDARVTTAFLSNLLDAGDVDYDNAVSGISANTVQEAIDYLNTLSGGGNQGDVASYTRQTFVGTDGVSNTTFTITDGYTLGYLEVYLNGVLLNNSDYTANDESTVVLATAARDDDELITIAHDSFAIAELLRTTSISASAPDNAIEVAANGTMTINANGSNTLKLDNTGATGYASMSMINSTSNLAHIGLGSVSAGNTDLRDTVFFGSISNLPVKFTQNDAIAASITTDGHFIISDKETLGVPTASVSSGLEVGSDVGGGFINISGGYTPDSALNIRDLEGSYVSFFIGPTKAGGIDVGAVDNLLIYNATAGHFGLELGSLGIAPTDNTGTSVDDTVDLGHSEKRFKVAHLSESVNTPEVKLMNGTDNFLTITKDAGNTFGVVGSKDVGLGFISSNDTTGEVRIIPRRIGTTVASDRLVDLGDNGSEFKDLYLGGNLIIDGTPLRPVYGFKHHKTSSPVSTTAADNWYTYSAGQFTYTTTKTNSYIHIAYNLDSGIAFDNPTGTNHGYVEVRLRVEHSGSTFYSSPTRFWMRVDNFTGVYEITRLLTGEWTSAITAPSGTVITVVPEYLISRTAGTGLSRGGISTWGGTSMISLWELKA